MNERKLDIGREEELATRRDVERVLYNDLKIDSGPKHNLEYTPQLLICGLFLVPWKELLLR